MVIDSVEEEEEVKSKVSGLGNLSGWMVIPFTEIKNGSKFEEKDEKFSVGQVKC